MPDITRKCIITGHEFVISEGEQDVIRRINELHPLLKDGDLPLSTIHPYESQRQFFSFCNQLNLYKSKSNLSGKHQLSCYSPEGGYKICTADEFWTDDIDNCEFGRDYDFSRPFFEQLNDVMHDSYLQPLTNEKSENSDYANMTLGLKDSYMCFAVSLSENCMYCRSGINSKDCVDCTGVMRCELCYGSVDIEDSYNVQYCQDCTTCNDCIGCTDCIGCKNCFGCLGLNHADYHILNKKMKKEEYDDFLSKIDLGDYLVREKILKKVEDFIKSKGYKKKPRIKNCEDCTGSYLKNSKNLYDVYIGEDSRDCGYGVFMGAKDCWRGEAYFGSELCYSTQAAPGYLSLFNIIDIKGERNFYNYTCFRCKDCFGCVMLKDKSYCILNKQYSKDEYYELVPRIIKHMKETGEFGLPIPPKYSPFFYDESVLPLWFEPISDEEKKKRAYRMGNLKEPGSDVESTIGSKDVPENIKDVDDSILKEVIKSERSGKTFRYVKQEIKYYKEHNIPLPRIHWKERFDELTKKKILLPSV